MTGMVHEWRQWVVPVGLIAAWMIASVASWALMARLPALMEGLNAPEVTVGP